MSSFLILDNEPHVVIVPTVARLRAGPTMISGVRLGGHEALFSARDIIGRHMEHATLISRVNDNPFNNTEPPDSDRPLDGAHGAEITRDRSRNEIAQVVRDGN